jgi:hypothetical protein
VDVAIKILNKTLRFGIVWEANGSRTNENTNDANIKYVIKLSRSSILCLLINLLKTNDSAKKVAAKKDNKM